MSFIVGVDFIETAVTKMVQQYVDVYNVRWDGGRVSPQESHNTTLNEHKRWYGTKNEQFQLEVKGKY